MVPTLQSAYTMVPAWRVIWTRLRFSLIAQDLDLLPRHGAALLASNQLDETDQAVLQAVSPRPLHFLALDDPAVTEHGHKLLQLGAVVCVSLPASVVKHLTQVALSPLVETLARENQLSVFPVWVDRIWPVIFSHRQRRVYVGSPLPPGQPALQSALLELSARALQDQPALKVHIGYACIQGAKQNFFREVLTDAYQHGRTLTGGKLLAVCLAFADWLKAHVPEERVGLVLPPGLGGSIANLGCVLADKVPVNLNFTAGPTAIQSAITRSEIKTILTAAAMVDKAKDFPWTDRRFDLKDVLGSLPKYRVTRWWLLALLLPARWLRIRLGLSAHNENREAGLLFTSGSAGEPKGVVLSHRNILANVAQIKAVFSGKPIESLLGCLPIFHSFGCTVTFWWPLMGGPRVVTYPSPMETAKLADIIEKYRITVFINTPTFLRAYLRKAKPEQLRSILTVVTGAEKCPVDLIEEFERTFDVAICEGYGMTEATPVVAVNILTDWHERTRQTDDGGHRRGSVGPLLPGLAAQIRDPDTDAPHPLNQSGLLWLKGANVFSGYLNDPERTRQVLQDGWYKTGDIGRLDPEGFLFIEGRLSRFSKVAGEMVPHGVIEDAIRQVLGPQDEEAPSLVVTGIPDPQRGEELVVLTIHDWNWNEMKQKLSARGLPNLWIPKTVKKVEKIPLMATGKLDLRACQELAKQT